MFVFICCLFALYFVFSPVRFTRRYSNRCWERVEDRGGRASPAELLPPSRQLLIELLRNASTIYSGRSETSFIQPSVLRHNNYVNFFFFLFNRNDQAKLYICEVE